jgi:hypothetical protein
VADPGPSKQVAAVELATHHELTDHRSDGSRSC